MKNLVTLIVGLLSLWALIQVCISWKTPAIQADIRTRIENALADAKYVGIDITVDGRDVSLSGTVTADVFARLAFDITDNVRGVRVVDGNLTVASQAMPAQNESIKSRAIEN